MVEWLSDLIARAATGLTVRDVLTDDAEAAMQHLAARGLYEVGTFSRKQVNCVFHAGLQIRQSLKQVRLESQFAADMNWPRIRPRSF